MRKEKGIGVGVVDWIELKLALAKETTFFTNHMLCKIMIIIIIKNSNNKANYNITWSLN